MLQGPGSSQSDVEFSRKASSGQSFPRRLLQSGLAIAALVLLSFTPLLGCHEGNPVSGKPHGFDHVFPVRGTVVSLSPASHDLVLKHGDVPGLMPAMTMTYHVADPAVLQEVHPGDMISASIDASNMDQMILRDVVIVGQARPDYKPTEAYHVPAPGDLVPNFHLLNQSGRTIDLKQFRGKVVALTFIYTRCPLSSFCPRMSHNFASIDQQVDKDPRLAHSTQLLSISFDPAHDTPKVLTSYGEAYLGSYTQSRFTTWQFTVVPQPELDKVEHYFALGVTPGQDGTLQHSLSTVVIGKDGKVVGFWPSNDWTVGDLMTKIKAAAG